MSYVPIDSSSIQLHYDNLSTDASFDAILSKDASTSSCKLTIFLRVRLAKIEPTSLPWVHDADNKMFWVRPWGAADWFNFVNEARRQADMWNGKLWLKPPPSFTDFDTVDRSGAVLRPFIQCELLVDFYGLVNPHSTIRVANLDMNKYLNPAPENFRSHALLYDSLDLTPTVFPVPDHTGKVNSFTHSTIAHEVGHSIGLHHIGVLLKTPLCEFAVAAEQVGLDQSPLTQGGTNASYCYGWGQTPAIGSNIMGYGTAISAENGKPWVWAILQMRRQQPWSGSWEVLTANPGPYGVVKRKSM